jgi:hypothetical protein
LKQNFCSLLPQGFCMWYFLCLEHLPGSLSLGSLPHPSNFGWHNIYLGNPTLFLLIWGTFLILKLQWNWYVSLSTVLFFLAIPETYGSIQPQSCVPMCVWTTEAGMVSEKHEMS